MAGKQAKILSEDDFEDLLVYAAATRNPLRNRVIVLLSAKAGLRVPLRDTLHFFDGPGNIGSRRKTARSQGFVVRGQQLADGQRAVAQDSGRIFPRGIDDVVIEQKNPVFDS